MSQFLADPSWSFLKITNGVLSLARNSINDIETQFMKHEVELTNSIEKLSKSFQQTKDIPIQKGPNNPLTDENIATNELNEDNNNEVERQPKPKLQIKDIPIQTGPKNPLTDEKFATIESNDDNINDVERQPKPKPSRARKKQILFAASEPAENVSEDHNCSAISATNLINSDMSGANTCENVTISESGDLNQNLSGENYATCAEGKADVQPTETVLSPIVSRTRSRRKVQPTVVTQPRETRSRRRARKQEPVAEVDGSDAKDSTPVVSAEICATNPSDSKEINPEVKVSELVNEELVREEASKIEEVPEQAARPRARRGRKAATTRTTRQRKKAAVQKLADDEEANSTIAETVEVVDLTESTGIAHHLPPVQPLHEEADLKVAVLAQSGPDSTDSQEINTMSRREIQLDVPSTLQNAPVVVEEAHLDRSVSPRQSIISAGVTASDNLNTFGSQNSHPLTAPGSDDVEPSESSNVHASRGIDLEENVSPISLSDFSSSAGKQNDLPMEISPYIDSLSLKASQSLNLSAESPVVKHSFEVNRTNVQPISTAVLPLNIQTVTVPKQESLLQSLLDDDNLSDSEDMQVDEPPVNFVQQISKPAVETILVDTQSTQNDQNNSTNKSALSVGTTPTPKIDHPDAPFPYRFIPPTICHNTVNEAKSSPLGDFRGMGCETESGVVPNPSPPIKPPSCLSNSSQPLFLSVKSNAFNDPKSTSADKVKKSTPPVSGVLQSLLMKARADSIRRQCPAKPNQSALATALSSDVGSNSISTPSTCIGSEPFSVQQNAALSHNSCEKAAMLPLVISPNACVNESSLLSSTAAFSASNADVLQDGIEVDALHHSAASKTESISVKKSSTQLTCNETVLVESNDSCASKGASVPYGRIASSNLDSPENIPNKIKSTEVSKSDLSEKPEKIRSKDKPKDGDLKLDMPVQALYGPEVRADELAQKGVSLKQPPTKATEEDRPLESNVSSYLPTVRSEDKPKNKNLNGHASVASPYDPECSSNPCPSVIAKDVNLKQPPTIAIGECQHWKSDVSRNVPTVLSEDKRKTEDSNVNLTASTKPENRRSGKSVANQNANLEAPRESCSHDVVSSENSNLRLLTDSIATAEQSESSFSAVAGESRLLEAPGKRFVYEEVDSAIVAKADNLDRPLATVALDNVEDDKNKKFLATVSTQSSVFAPEETGNVPIPSSILVPEIETSYSPQEELESELGQSDDDMDEDETLGDNQPEQPDQTSKSGSVWDSLYNGFNNISTNVASFVRPKVPDAKAKRVVEVKALKLANAKRKRDMERQEEIKLRNKKFQEVGEERKRKAIEQDRLKETTLHGATDSLSGPANASVSRPSAKAQDCQKKPAERLVELSSEERRKRAEERRLALEEEEKRKRQEKEENRQLQRELLKKRRKEEDDIARKKHKIIEEPSKKLGTILPSDNASVLSKNKDGLRQTANSSLQNHKFAVPQLPAPRHLSKPKSEEDHYPSEPVVEIPTEPDPSDYESDEESDEKDLKMKIPKWAQHPNLLNALSMQASTDPDTVFDPHYLKTCDLTEMFTDYSSKTRFTRRTSSGNWLQDRLGWREELEYKRRNGFLQ